MEGITLEERRKLFAENLCFVSLRSLRLEMRPGSISSEP